MVTTFPFLPVHWGQLSPFSVDGIFELALEQQKVLTLELEKGMGLISSCLKELAAKVKIAV